MLKISNNETTYNHIKQLNNFSPPTFPTWTQVLDLTKSEDEILKSFHSKTRYNIRLSEKKAS